MFVACHIALYPSYKLDLAVDRDLPTHPVSAGDTSFV
jgi:hypothetical protein